MNNDYLWDGSGEPDPDFERLEKSLAQFRYGGDVPVFPAIDELDRKRSLFTFFRRTWTLRYAAFAVLAIAIVTSGVVLRWPLPPESNSPEWDVARVTGVPRVGHFSLAHSKKAQLKVGQLLETDKDSSALLS